MRDMRDAKRKVGRSLFRQATIGILITIISGAIAAVAGMYTDISLLQQKEKTLTQKVDVIDSNVKDIKWFLIERNGGNIDKRNKR